MYARVNMYVLMRACSHKIMPRYMRMYSSVYIFMHMHMAHQTAHVHMRDCMNKCRYKRKDACFHEEQSCLNT